ncbi:DUF4091 domain-containing protein [Flavivirga spongiicola]|uniref:DUF4091 domain-containing protein n=1 Tax=Flavivirga spongiicola TaxID=421621 RepID=A0ABU7XYV9_9FLAO|nr:glycoside hydrolase domain-containing protein [Flavivirga sp. MEBiC05379]MDO5980954.1 DUF6067 family protein [Flavivirga sp. MEBiC05379]
MKNSFYHSRLILVVLIIFNFNCASDKLTKKINETISLDDIETVPEWLNLNVDEVFLTDSLNIWVPTGNFQTSSLIRVPRFPRKFSEEELIENEALKDFEIVNLVKESVLELTAVKNEQVSAQIALGSKKDISKLKVSINGLKASNGEVINKENFQIRYVKYVPIQRARSEYDWSPKLEEIIGEGVSGNMTPDIVGDPLLELKFVDIPAYRAQPVWITFRVPENVNPGTYKGSITISSKQHADVVHKIKLHIQKEKLPDPKDYKFHLDLWLNPSAIAEYYNLEHWSEPHWSMISKYLKDYASRGGKNLATTITHEPWLKPWISNSTRSQIAFGYRSMVQWTLNEKGDWEFDYSVFDRYVDMATQLGIDEAINTFSMAPFKETKQRLHYFDKKDNAFKNLELDIHDVLYKDIWTKFLISFKKYLLSKNLTERTFLGFDEKTEEDMQVLLAIIKTAAPEFLDKIIIAGHPEGDEYAKNLSISYMFFPEQPLERKAVVPVLPTIEGRKSDNKRTTFYLCAEPAHPNALTYSPAIESQLIPWLALKYNTDGYLRWSYNNWTKDPFKNPVFRHNQGDDYYVYPGKDGPISSIRWELLKEGIEDYELFNIIKKAGNIPDKELLKAIELATRNQDGRFKKANDLAKSRNILSINRKGNQTLLSLKNKN